MKIELSDKEAEFLVRCLVQNYASIKEDYGEDISSSGIGEFIIGKLIAADHKLRDTFHHATDEIQKKENPLNKNIFLGSGFYSKIQINFLHKRLNHAFYVKSGMQQNGSLGALFDEEAYKKDLSTIEEIIQDIKIGLGLNDNCT